MAPIFASYQTSCWSDDKYDSDNAIQQGIWIIDFKQGQILQAAIQKKHSGQLSWGRFAAKKDTNYVKAVRSVR